MMRNLVAASLVVIGIGGCSLLNREGPDIDCAGVPDGAQNLCDDGIIASCISGAPAWRVCADAGACEESWQVDGHARCSSTDPIPESGTGSSVGSGGGVGTSSGPGSGPGAGGASSICEDDEPCPVADAGGQTISTFILEGGRIFFSACGTGFWSVPVSGGVPKSLGPTCGYQMVSDGPSVYFANVEGALFRIGVEGGFVDEYPTDAVSGFGVLGSTIYYVSQGGRLRSYEIASATVTDLSESLVDTPQGGRVVSAGNAIYWAGYDRIFAFDTSGPIPAAPSSVAIPGVGIADLTIDSEALYISDSGNGWIIAFDLDTQVADALVDGQEDPAAIAVDEDSVYWIDGASREVRKTSKSGGAVATVGQVTSSSYHRSLAVDATHVYWVDRGHVWRAPK